MHVGGHLTVSGYRQAIAGAVERAAAAGRQVEHWFPLQCRHTGATVVRAAGGLEAAQGVLGHAEMNVSEVYAEKNADLARRIVEEVG